MSFSDEAGVQSLEHRLSPDFPRFVPISPRLALLQELDLSLCFIPYTAKNPQELCLPLEETGKLLAC